ncbi:SitA6 family polymorphic toxin lipoprotein [Stigmatella hybrida]|uniref:SitA6 family polymorphic toxin lipoprotein n=1 Tax=Stigmatella hybrida TaxID=394097 RepID=UPI001CDA7F60|nr:TIGR02269 family lipoprotein [Stigmatella hybrida]
MSLIAWIRTASLSVLLASCASTAPSRCEPAKDSAASSDEVCQGTTTLELFCAPEACALFRCQDLVVAGEATSLEVEPARWNRLFRGSGWPRRGWRYPRADAAPVFVIRWNNHPAPLLPRQRSHPPESVERHHIFPQAPDLAAWFSRHRIKIHDYTLLIPRDVHRKIHGGGPRGGRWNEEWRRWMEERDTATHEEIWRHAIKLIVQYDLTGSQMVPYR